MIKTIAISAGLFILALIFFSMTSVGVNLWRYHMAPFFGMVDAEVQIESGANRRYTYDHFFNLCAAVRSTEAKIDEQRTLLASAPEANQAMIYTNIAGLTSARANYIEEYNADANKAYTSARFLSDQLPRQLDHSSYTGIKTNCN